ncbi:MAG: MaoC family dehydratase N-terminal domain-containing protein [Dehalococcoidia bacterium]
MSDDATYLDLHVHSAGGSDDAGGTVEGYLKWIAARRALGFRIDGFVVTEHRRFDPDPQLDRDYAALAARYEATVLRGVEVETDIGHVLVFGVTPEFLRGFDLTSVSLPHEDVFRTAWETGGVAVGAHAGRPRIGCVEHADERGVTLEGVGVIEALNGGSNDYENGRAFDLAEARGLRVVGASDAHFVSALGRCLTRFDRPVRTMADLVGALRDPAAAYVPMHLDDTKDGVAPRPRPSGAPASLPASSGMGNLGSDEIEYDRSVVGREIPVGRFEVTHELINGFCEAIGQQNPLYTDEAFAAQGPYGGIIAPPGIAQAVRMDPAPNPRVQFGRSPLMAGQRHEYYLPVRPGDVIEGFAQVKEVYEKTGRSGRMVFVLRRTRYANQHGEDVAAVETTSVHREVKPLDEEA